MVAGEARMNPREKGEGQWAGREGEGGRVGTEAAAEVKIRHGGGFSHNDVCTTPESRMRDTTTL